MNNFAHRGEPAVQDQREIGALSYSCRWLNRTFVRRIYSSHSLFFPRYHLDFLSVVDFHPETRRSRPVLPHPLLHPPVRPWLTDISRSIIIGLQASHASPTSDRFDANLNLDLNLELWANERISARRPS